MFYLVSPILLVASVLTRPTDGFFIRPSVNSRADRSSRIDKFHGNTVASHKRSTALLVGGKVDDTEKAGNTTEVGDDDLATSQMLVEGLESSLKDLESILVNNETFEQHDNVDFQLALGEMEGIENVAGVMGLPPKDWREEMVLTNKQDPMVKLVSTIVKDPALRVVSSELGVKEWVHTNVKEDYLPNSGQIPIDTLIQRTMDTVEDVFVHLRRLPYEKGTMTLTKEQDARRKTVVILGSGWAAHALMKVADCSKLRLIVVSPSNHFVFTPMLASSAVGTVEYRSMTEAVRAANPMIDEYIEGKAIGVDVKNKNVQIRLNDLLTEYREGKPPELEMKYDHLVVSVGCKVDDKGVPGAERALRLKTCDDAVRLRRAIGEALEYASRPDVAGAQHAEERTKRATFVIVGGGPTGVELAGEILDLAADLTRPHKGSYPKLKDNIRVVLAHSGPELVPQFDTPLRTQAVKSLEKKGAKVLLNTRVNEVGDGFVKLSTTIIDEETGEVTGREEIEMPNGITVWCAGTAPVSFVDQLLDQLPDSAQNSDGRVKVDKWMRPPMPKNDMLGSVLVLGDAAAFPEGHEYITTDKLLPQTAQVAGQQGAYAARMLDRGYDLTVTPPTLQDADGSPINDIFIDPLMIQWLQIRGLETAPRFVFLNLGLLAYLGGGEALSQVMIGDFPLFSYFGSVAYILWRSVYLVKQVATRNRVLVTFDWIKSAIFGRDITRF